MTSSFTDLAALPSPLVSRTVETALVEDLGLAGDLTTDAIVPADATVEAWIVAREPGVVSGTAFAQAAFRSLDPAISIDVVRSDGARVAAADVVLALEGAARAVLSAERVALNFLIHMSGIATLTARYVEAVSATQAAICCTRKTLPGLRMVEKYAVRCGGGMNHRIGLGDAILIKDNHIACAGGVDGAISAARRRAGHMIRIEVEVDTLDQLEIVLAHDIDVVMLDNMDNATLRKAVALIDGRVVTEASGGVTLETVAAIAATGVDMISVGALTHSAPALDLGLDFTQPVTTLEV